MGRNQCSKGNVCQNSRGKKSKSGGVSWKDLSYQILEYTVAYKSYSHVIIGTMSQVHGMKEEKHQWKNRILWKNLSCQIFRYTSTYTSYSYVRIGIGTVSYME